MSAATEKVFEVKTRVLVFATIYVAATSSKQARKKLEAIPPQFGRADFEEHSLRLDHFESAQEVKP